MKNFSITVLLLAASLIANCQEDSTQVKNLRNESIDIFIDCEFCDLDFIKNEIKWVNYVRDASDAQVHIIITEQNTGSMGTEYSVFLVGQKDFSFQNDIQKFVSEADDSDEEVRDGLTQLLKLSLMRYIAKTPLINYMEINYLQDETTEVQDTTDPWKSWVYSTDLNTWLMGEESYKYLQLYGNVSASKVTEKIKFESEIGISRNESRFTFEDTTIIGLTNMKYLEMLCVKSMGSHLSLGVFSGLSSSTYNNQKLNSYFAPAIEYNLFPYSESSRRQLRLLYFPLGQYSIYNDTTIYNKTEELNFKESVQIAFEMIEKWGSVSLSGEASHYFSDFSKNRLSVYSSLRLRIVKGLSLNLSGNVSLIHDLISLPKENASSDEVLLRQRQLATQYSYSGNIGITYTFGSTYNNVVNPRFGN